MARTKQAKVETRTAPLWEEFGIEYATRLFGAEALTDLPRYARGPNAGKPKAFLRWMRATSNGWCRECQGPVSEGGLVRAWITSAQFGHSNDEYVLTGNWLGRTQPLCGSRAVLGEANRTAEIQRQEAARADDEARWAEIKAELATH